MQHNERPDWLRNYAKYNASGDGLSSAADLTDDGRISISLDLKKSLPDLPKDYAKEVHEFATDSTNYRSPPCLNVVIMIVGSRGDVQPFVALAKKLQKDGHRIRIASHGTFRSFVTEHDIEFFNIGGDPEDLMSYMVKNPGLVPGLASLTNGDIGRKRTMLKEMLEGCWRSCIDADPETGKTFAADAIISNPPAFAHVHCAEALGIPLNLSFTMPWCATTAFPHPLVNIQSSNAKKGLSNYLSYALTDLMTWQGLGDIIDDFREKSLGLSGLTIRKGPSIVDKLKIPWTYSMSPALVPKPKDWKNHIDVVGFYFLDLSSNYTPPADLAAFLDAGPPPLYIGFGSIVIEDPQALTATIFQAVANSGTRALLSAGWGGLGSGSVPDNIFILGNVPHDWLFDKVSAVVHHGGAGTTAIGLLMGKPTVVVPFFGDQPFWGDMIYQSGAGPEPIRQKELDVEKLTKAIEFVLKPAAQEAALQLSRRIQSEDGIANGALSFYRHLPLLNMRCDLEPSRVAVWWSTEHCLKLSAFAAQTLANKRLIDMNKLDQHRASEFNTSRKVTDPVTGGATSIFWTVTNYYTGIAQIFYNPVKGVIKTTTAIPRGVLSIVTSIHEGLNNMPQLYGSQVRETNEVDSFSSGVKAGGKALFYGYYDGITGLVKEPIQGAKKEGFIGAIKGSARSSTLIDVNATARPAAGIVGLVAQPLQGAWTSAVKRFAKKPIQAQRTTRIGDGLQDVRDASEAQRQDVLAAFKRATVPSAERERKERIREAAKEVLMEAHEDVLHEESPTPDPMVPAGTTPEVSTQSPSAPSSSTLASLSSSPSSLGTKADRPNELQNSNSEEDAQFLKNLERATQLSLHFNSANLSSPSISPSAYHKSSGLTEEEQQFLNDLEKAKQLSSQENPE